MKFSKSDLRLLRWGIAILCLALIIAGTTFYIAEQSITQSRRALNNAQSALSQARNQLITAQQDRANMDFYMAEYAALIEEKVIGVDQRLDWMEGMEQLRQKNIVSSFSYNIAPQKTFAPVIPVDSGNFDINFSEMKLQFNLLHEGQLINFFDALRSNIQGWYQLQGCTLQRAGAGEIADNPIQLKAECNGGWITLKNRSIAQ